MSGPSMHAGNPEIEIDPYEGRVRDECGVFGVFALQKKEGPCSFRSP